MTDKNLESTIEIKDVRELFNDCMPTICDAVANIAVAGVAIGFTLASIVFAGNPFIIAGGVGLTIYESFAAHEKFIKLQKTYDKLISPTNG